MTYNFSKSNFILRGIPVVANKASAVENIGVILSGKVHIFSEGNYSIILPIDCKW